jgi:hypothetical protein
MCGFEFKTHGGFLDARQLLAIRITRPDVTTYLRLFQTINIARVANSRPQRNSLTKSSAS